MRRVITQDPVAFLKGEIPTHHDGRVLIAVAGPPASGKSTLAAGLVDALTDAVLVPMDGFHLDNETLSKRGVLAKKGAPETFDADGFITAIGRLRKRGTVTLPGFDREQDQAIPDAIVVADQHRVVVVEGNYLCFREAPWNGLMALWDMSVFLDEAEDVIEQRLMQRWIDLGLSRTEASEKVHLNDMINARRIARSRVDVDVVFGKG